MLSLLFLIWKHGKAYHKKGQGARLAFLKTFFLLSFTIQAEWDDGMWIFYKLTFYVLRIMARSFAVPTHLLKDTEKSLQHTCLGIVAKY